MAPSPSRARGWITFAVLALASVFLLVVPLFRPHGIYFDFHYRLPDLYLGVPLFLAALGVLVVQLTPAERRRARALRLTGVGLLLGLVVYGMDLGVVLLTTFTKFPHYDVWLYASGISSKHSVPDDELGFVRRPGLRWSGPTMKGLPGTTYNTDEHGFRNPSGLQKADVAIVGDSFVEAGAVLEEQTAVRRLQQATGLATVNLGRTHYGPQQYLIVTRRYALPYHPRAVVWSIFEGNDLSDTDAFLAWRANPSSRQSLFQRFASRSLVAQVLPRTPTTLRGRRQIRLTDGTLGDFDLDYIYDPEAPAHWRKGWAGIARALKDGAELCKANGVEFLVVFVPIKARVLGDHVLFRDQADRDANLPGGLMDAPHDFTAAVREECGKIGCDFVDLAPPLRRAAAVDNHHVYFNAIDTHLDVAGNQVLADEVKAWLSRRGVTGATASTH